MATPLTPYSTARLFIQRARGTLRALRPATLARDAANQYGDLLKAQPTVQFFPDAERSKMQIDIHQSIERDRKVLAGVGLHYLQSPIQDLVKEGRQARERLRKDVHRSAPAALDGVSPDGLVILSCFRLLRTAQISTASVSMMATIYEQALQRKDASSTVDLEVIEALVDGGQLAKTEGDLPAVRQLRELVDNVRELRIPLGLGAPDWDSVDKEASVLRVRAAALGVQPVNVVQQPAVLKVWQSQLPAIEAAGALSDEDSIEELRQQLAEAGAL